MTTDVEIFWFNMLDNFSVHFVLRNRTFLSCCSEFVRGRACPCTTCSTAFVFRAPACLKRGALITRSKRELKICYRSPIFLFWERTLREVPFAFVCRTIVFAICRLTTVFNVKPTTDLLLLNFYVIFNFVDFSCILTCHYRLHYFHLTIYINIFSIKTPFTMIF